MDRRQIKTREAIFEAFGRLLAQKKYTEITVQDIIDEANIGRSTFYSHFETKDFLLEEMCERLFMHIIESVRDCGHTHGLKISKGLPPSVFVHLIKHIEENDHNIIGMLTCESRDLFLVYFKRKLNELISNRYGDELAKNAANIPMDYLVNFISSGFVDTVVWWLDTGRKDEASTVAGYFETIVHRIG